LKQKINKNRTKRIILLNNYQHFIRYFCGFLKSMAFILQIESSITQLCLGFDFSTGMNILADTKFQSMTRILLLVLIANLSIFSTCSREEDSLIHINCDGLVTDTTGTNDNGRVFMPSAFTPNGDGKNDICRPLTQNITSIAFTIYDENNTQVYATTQVGVGWPAPPVSNSAVKYYYRIQAITNSNHKIGICGEVYRLSCFPAGVPRSSIYFEDQLTPNGFTGVTSEVLSNCP
jgi:hypothetical protein